MTHLHVEVEFVKPTVARVRRWLRWTRQGKAEVTICLTLPGRQYRRRR